MVDPGTTVSADVPRGFEFLGYDVTNSWEGLSIISSQPFGADEWRQLRAITAGRTNEWNLITDFEVAERVARLGAVLVPDHGPFAPVAYGFCPAMGFVATNE
jgi:hypothetical protein